jgi:hypothetical protein
MMSLADEHAEPRPGLATRLSQQADRDTMARSKSQDLLPERAGV